VNRSEIRQGRAEYLIEIRLGGTPYRFGSIPMTVARADGTSTVWQEGLAAVEGMPRSATSSAITIAGGSVDWALLVARGQDLLTARATLYRIWPDQVLDAAEIVLDGAVDSPEWGSKNEPLTFTLDAEPWKDRGQIPSAGMCVDDVTWPTDPQAEIDEVARGAAYPIPIGRPGAASWGADGVLVDDEAAIGTSPAYLVEYNDSGIARDLSVLMVAGVPIHASQVLIYDASDGIVELRTVQEMTDNLGRTVSYVDFLSATNLRAILGHEYHVAWPPGEGGIWDAQRRTYARGAGEVLYVLYSQLLSRLEPGTRPNIPLDFGRMLAQRAYLDRFQVDGVIRESTTIHEWIENNLAPILPIEWVRGRRGWYWQAWRYDAVASDAVAHLDASTGRVKRVSRARAVGSEQLRSQFRLQYGCGADGVPQRRRILAPAASSDDDRVRPSSRCWIAQAREIARNGGSGIVEWEYTSEVVQDDATADRIVEVMAARMATPPLPASYEGGPELESLEVGDVVLVSDAEIYWTRRIAIVRDIIPGEIVRLDLDVLTDPPRVQRVTT